MTDLIAVTEWAWPLGVFGLLCAYAAYRYVARRPGGAEALVELGDRIHEGVIAFLRREYTAVAVFLAVVATLLGLAVGITPALAYVLGASSSMGAGFLGMSGAARANTRTAAAAMESGQGKAMRTALFGGSVMGLSVASLVLVGLGILFVAYAADAIPGTDEFPFFAEVVSAFALGVSSIALFARLGGGIFAKSADIAADLVRRVEPGLSDEDPRNPVTIAEKVGDNVVEVAGMGADLFESYVAAVAATIAIGATAPELAEHRAAAVALPLLAAMAGLLASLVGVGATRLHERAHPRRALRGATLVAAAVFLGLTYIATRGMGITFVDAGTGRAYPAYGPWLAMLAGTLVGVAIALVTEYYTSAGPVRRIADASRTGSATNVIAGLTVGMESTVVPGILLCVAVGLSYTCAGLYGIGIAAVGMIGTVGATLSVHAFGPIVDIAGALGGMGHLGPDTREVTDSLDSAGSTTGAMGKGFAVGAAALTAFALLSAYASTVGLRDTELGITDPNVTMGLLLGAIMPFLVSALSMTAVMRTADRMVEEACRQLREIPGLREGAARADSTRCVDVSTRVALREMILPGLPAVVVPVAVGYFLGVAALGGMLAGATITGVLMALFMANAGGAWESARKYIEGGAMGGKGSDPHKAAAVGDTVGDPFRDTSGASLNVLVKLIGVVSLVLAPWLVRVHDVRAFFG